MKLVESKAVIDNRSAMPLRDRRTILTQELLRIFLRCSPLLPLDYIKKHLDHYMLRLQFSGYSEKIRRQLVQSAANAYKKIKASVDRGERPLYRRKEWKKEVRMREKRKKREN